MNRIAMRPDGQFKRALVVLVATLSVLFAGAVVTGPASAKSDDLVFFTDADRTVACEISISDYDGDALRCDVNVVSALPPLPPRPSDCPAEWANIATMSASGLPQWGACVGDTILPGATTMATGSVVELGNYRCQTLAQGVTCRDTSTGYGFELSPTTYKITRPSAKSKVSPSGIGKLKFGMTVKRARRTGLLGGEECGGPQLKDRLGWNARLGWRNGRLDQVVSSMYSRVQSTKGVGVGSTLAEVLSAYPSGRVTTTTDLQVGETKHAYLVRNKHRVMVFLLQAAETSVPDATTPVDFLWAARNWKPKDGMYFGC